MGLARYESLQPHYNLVHRAEFERELAAVCRDQELGVIPYKPLAGGFLSGKYRRDQALPDSSRASVDRNFQKLLTERNFALVDKLVAIGQAHSASAAQVALAWLLSNPIVTAPIIGANTAAQLKENLVALTLELSAEEITSLSELSAWTD